MAGSVVLSLFPGIGLLDRAFEEAGFCVVRGPDVIWGGDVKSFHPPAGVFAGIIGGPPCQLFTALRRLNPMAGQRHGNLIPEFERCVAEAAPEWFVMENAPDAPAPKVEGYYLHAQLLDNRWLGEAQSRRRRISFGTRDARRLNIGYAVFDSLDYAPAVTGSGRAVPVKIGGSGRVKRTYNHAGARSGPGIGPMIPIGRALELQGCPADMLDECPLTVEGKRQAVGNGVPLPMGRAIAQAVVNAMKPKPRNNEVCNRGGEKTHE